MKPKRSGGHPMGAEHRLQSDIRHLEQRQDEFRQELAAIQSRVDQGFYVTNDKIASMSEMLSRKLDQKTSTNWVPIGIAVSAMLTVGIALYEARAHLASDLAYIKGQLNPLPRR
jgi:hypothetical protein